MPPTKQTTKNDVAVQPNQRPIFHNPAAVRALAEKLCSAVKPASKRSRRLRPGVDPATAAERPHLVAVLFAPRRDKLGRRKPATAARRLREHLQHEGARFVQLTPFTARLARKRFENLSALWLDDDCRPIEQAGDVLAGVVVGRTDAILRHTRQRMRPLSAVAIPLGTQEEVEATIRRTLVGDRRRVFEEPGARVSRSDLQKAYVAFVKASTPKSSPRRLDDMTYVERERLRARNSEKLESPYLSAGDAAKLRNVNNKIDKLNAEHLQRLREPQGATPEEKTVPKRKKTTEKQPSKTAEKRAKEPKRPLEFYTKPAELTPREMRNRVLH